MKKLHSIILSLAMTGLFFPMFSQQYIADCSVAKEEVLRSIPAEYIDKARTEFVVAYQHTSHGTHVSRGVFGLQDYKNGDDLLFGVSVSPVDGKLDFRDYALESYAPSGINGIDLSADETAFIQTTRNFLDASENADVNIIMWSWCNIAGHNVEGNYLPGMDSLISEYGPGGSKIGTGEGQRELSVRFILMTGHPNENANAGTLQPKPQSELITSYCNTNAQFCLDYYSIDSHDMADNYWEDVNDNGLSSAYGGNFYLDWQNASVVGEDYYYNRSSPGGAESYGSHLSQHITGNRKAYAFWWILARMAGWDSETTSSSNISLLEPVIYPNPCTGTLYIKDLNQDLHQIQIARSDGVIVRSIIQDEYEQNLSIDMSDYSSGIYILSLADQSSIQITKRILLIK